MKRILSCVMAVALVAGMGYPPLPPMRITAMVT